MQEILEISTHEKPFFFFFLNESKRQNQKGFVRLLYGKLLIWQVNYMESSIIVYDNCIFSFFRFI